MANHGNGNGSVPQRRTIQMAHGGSTSSVTSVLTESTYEEPILVLPETNVIKIGGQSIMDRGRVAVFPLVEEIVENAKKHQILIGAGGGTRARHAYSLALDLDLPTGVLASIGCATSRQNARILQMLLAKHGGVYLNPEDFEKLPLYFRVGCIPVMVGMPPYEYWEKPTKGSRIPQNRTDSGVYLTAEFLGARTCIFVKDEDGLYTGDPKKNKHAKFIPKITVQELLDRDLDDLVVEHIVLENMLKARNVRSIQVINGMVKGNLTRALNGEHVGTIIHVD
jgi:molybdenum storage protein